MKMITLSSLLAVTLAVATLLAMPKHTIQSTPSASAGTQYGGLPPCGLPGFPVCPPAPSR